MIKPVKKLLIGLTVFTVFSCDKQSEVQPEDNCLLKEITGSTNNVYYSFEYDINNNLIKGSEWGESSIDIYSEYEHYDDKVVEKHYEDGDLLFNKTYLVGNNRVYYSVETRSYLPIPTVDSIKFEYDADGYLIKSIQNKWQTPKDGFPSILTSSEYVYTYELGNLTNVHYSGAAEEYEKVYSYSKELATENVSQSIFFGNRHTNYDLNIFGNSSRNLLKSIVSKDGNKIESYDVKYSFNSDRRVTQVTIIPATDVSRKGTDFNFVYSCLQK